MRLHELADFVPNEYCERLEASFPDIVDLYQKNPYILLDKDYMLGENPPVSFVEIDRHTVLDTFLMRKMEMKAAIYHVLLQNEAQGNSWLGYPELKSAVMCRKRLITAHGAPVVKRNAVSIPYGIQRQFFL